MKFLVASRWLLLWPLALLALYAAHPNRCAADGILVASNSVEAGEWTQPFIEIIDAQAFKPNIASNIDIEPTGPVDDKFYRTGALTDGASVLVFRLHNFSGSGAVTFELNEGKEDLFYQNKSKLIGTIQHYAPGLVANPGLSNAKNFPDLPARDQPTGAAASRVWAKCNAGSPKIVFYRPPNNYLFGFHESSHVIEVVVRTDSWSKAFTFSLERPSLLISHGVVSKSDVVSYMVQHAQLEGAVHARAVTEWDNFTTSGYDSVVPKVQLAFYNERMMWRSQRIAATRCDWFGHSMGGVVAKWYLSDIPAAVPDRDRMLVCGIGTPPSWFTPILPLTSLMTPIPVPKITWRQTGTNLGNGIGQIYNKRSDNFNLGDCRRLITVGSPFQGSPVGNWVVTNVYYEYILVAIYPTGGGIGSGDGCAANDLSTSSKSLLTSVLMTQHPSVSWCPIIGVAAPGANRGSLGNDGIAYWINTLAIPDAGPSGVAGTPDAATSDCIVPITSQVDGHTLGGTFQSFTVPSVVHTGELQNPEVLNHLLKTEDLYYKPKDPGMAGHEGFTRCNPGF